MPIKTLIVDDEELARERIRSLLADDDQIEIVGECGNGRDAVAAIRKHRPELLFLDVQMPEMDGFAVLRALDSGTIPAIVFVTAHDQYALKAFEYVALDYLLKPFTAERFDSTLQRAKEQVRQAHDEDLRTRIGGLLDSLGEEPLERIVIRESGRISFMKVGEIRWIEAQGNYVKIHATGEAPLMRKSMKELERRLDPKKFLRIHRSIIVNIDRIRELNPLFHGEYRVLLDDGTELTSNRTFRETLQKLVD